MHVKTLHTSHYSIVWLSSEFIFSIWHGFHPSYLHGKRLTLVWTVNILNMNRMNIFELCRQSQWKVLLWIVFSVNIKTGMNNASWWIVPRFYSTQTSKCQLEMVELVTKISLLCSRVTTHSWFFSKGRWHLTPTWVNNVTNLPSYS